MNYPDYVKTKNKVDDLDYKSSIREGENELIASDRLFITPRAKLLAKKYNLAIISRGYGRRSSGFKYIKTYSFM